MKDETEDRIQFRGPNGCLSIEWEQDFRQRTDDCYIRSHLVRLDALFLKAELPVYLDDECFEEFLKSLIPIHEKVSGIANHKSIEGELTIKVEYFPNGHVIVSGELTNYDADSAARFSIKTDQSYMNKVILEAKKL